MGGFNNNKTDVISVSKRIEGYAPVPYLCIAGVVQNGYGSRDPKFIASGKKTEKEAHDQLVFEVNRDKNHVAKHVKVSLDESAQGAMAMLTRSIGQSAFAQSSFVKIFNTGKGLEKIDDVLLKYVWYHKRDAKGKKIGKKQYSIGLHKSRVVTALVLIQDVVKKYGNPKDLQYVQNLINIVSVCNPSKINLGDPKKLVNIKALHPILNDLYNKYARYLLPQNRPESKVAYKSYEMPRDGLRPQADTTVSSRDVVLQPQSAQHDKPAIVQSSVPSHDSGPLRRVWNWLTGG